MLRVRCRLEALLEEKNVTAEELAIASGLPAERIAAYCDAGLDAVSLGEAGALLTALGCRSASELFEVVPEGDAAPESAGDAPPMFEAEWYSPCPAAGDGRHSWFKDQAVSDSVYQEFVCQHCKRRLSVIL